LRDSCAQWNNSELRTPNSKSNAIHTKKKCQERNFETMTTKDEEIAIVGKAAASISVMAPSDMPGGYEFLADAGNGNSYKVRVVRKKQIFAFVQGMAGACRVSAGCLFVCCCSLDYHHHRICR
jgi:hypothetical protein